MTHRASDRSFDYEAQAAVDVLTRHFRSTGHNAKPVVWHSLRVGMRLYDAGFPRHVVISALLHDLLEDTEIEPREIATAFGADVLELVQALTFAPEISDRIARFEDRFQRCKVAGPDALAIMVTDFLDNSFFYRSGTGEQYQLYQQQHWMARTCLEYVESTAHDPRLASILCDLRRSLDRLNESLRDQE
jgi:GTP pyrophosphokinase